MNGKDKIIETCIIGILLNVITTIIKFSVGIMTGSPAIVYDAFNNVTSIISSVCDVIETRMEGISNPQVYNQISDLSSILISVLPIIGTAVAHKAPDKMHPYGYGRTEYLTSILISVLAMLVALLAVSGYGILDFKSAAHYNNHFLAVIAATVFVKLCMGIYYSHVGKGWNLKALVDCAKGEFLDAAVSFATLISAFASIHYGISFDGLLGLIISLVVIKSSWDLMRDSFDKFIGSRASPELSRKIKDTICEFPEVYGAYDLALHDYGSQRLVGSAHIEIDKDLTAFRIHKLSNAISTKIYEEFSVELIVGIYARDDRYDYIREDINAIASKHDGIIEVKGFSVFEAEKIITFDIIVDFSADREQVKNELLKEIREKHPEFNYMIIDDYDV